VARARFLLAFLAAYRGQSGAVWLLALVAVASRSTAMLFPFATVYVTSRLGHSASAAGVCGTLWAIGAIVGSGLGGVLSDRVDPLRVQLASLLGGAVCMLLLARTTNFAAICAIFCLQGVAVEMFRAANETSLAAAVDDDVRSFSLSHVVISLGFMIVPPIGGYLATIGYDLLFTMNGALCLTGAVILFLGRRLVPPGVRRSETSEPAQRLDAGVLLVLPATMAVMTVYTQMSGTWMLYLTQVHRAAETIPGLLLGWNGLLVVAMQMWLTRRVGRFRPLRVLAVGSLLVGIGFGILPIASGFAYWLGTVAVWTLGEMLWMPFIKSYVVQRVPPASRGRHLGLVSAVHSVSFLLAPVLGLWTYEHVSPGAVFVGCAVTGVVAAATFVATGLLTE